jgi:hypothetical protein
MFDGIDNQRVLRMTKREKRWLDNVRKAFYASDTALQTGTHEDRSLEELFKAIDTAKTLRRSLQGKRVSSKDNKKLFIDFLGLEVPCFRPGEFEIELRHARTGKLCKYSFGEIVYDIRCMIHENENLSAAEGVDYHVLLDWSGRSPLLAEVRGGQIVVNGFLLWSRLREVLAKFITIIEAVIETAEKGSGSAGIRPALGSIRPPARKRGGHPNSEATGPES